MSSHVTMIWPSADLRLFLGGGSRTRRVTCLSFNQDGNEGTRCRCGSRGLWKNSNSARWLCRTRPSSEKSCSSGQMRQLIGLYLCRFGSLSRVSKSKLTSSCHSCAPHPTGGESEETRRRVVAKQGPNKFLFLFAKRVKSIAICRHGRVCERRSALGGGVAHRNWRLPHVMDFGRKQRTTADCPFQCSVAFKLVIS